MDFFTLILVVSIIHCCLYFFDFFFKSCSMYPYIRFLQGTGLCISFFKITWCTKAFNRVLHKWGSLRSKLLTIWFMIGVLSTLILVPISVVLVFHSAYKTFNPNVSDNSEGVVMGPMVPGLNLPLADIGYYLLTLLVCSVLHELGHAVAAVNEDVHIAGVGLIIFILIPVCYVHLNTEQLSSLNPKRLLNIFCAGIWHNLILALAAYLFLSSLPILFYPVYDIGSGVSVQGIKKDSAIAGERGLFVGDKVVAINDCEVSSVESWRQCLVNTLHQPAPGYCVTPDLVHQLDESIPVKHIEGGVVECCSKDNDKSLCFEALDDGNPLNILQYSCLPARPVVTGSSYTCRIPTDCPAGLHCIRPGLRNGTTLLRFQVHQGANTHVIFLGHPWQVLSTVDATDYHPIYRIFPSLLPEGLSRLAKYLSVFSLGLAVLNAIPCFYLDGNHIINALLLFFFQKNKKLRRMHKGICFCCNLFGTCLLLSYFVLVLFKSAF